MRTWLASGADHVPLIEHQFGPKLIVDCYQSGSAIGCGDGELGDAARGSGTLNLVPKVFGEPVNAAIGNATRVEVVKCTPLIGQQQPQMKLLVYPSLPPVQRNAVITTCSPPTANRRPVQAPQPLAPGPFVLRLPCS